MVALRVADDEKQANPTSCSHISPARYDSSAAASGSISAACEPATAKLPGQA